MVDNNKNQNVEKYQDIKDFKSYNSYFRDQSNKAISGKICPYQDPTKQMKNSLFTANRLQNSTIHTS